MPLTKQDVLGGRVILHVAGKYSAKAMLFQDKIEKYSARLLAWLKGDALAPATAAKKAGNVAFATSLLQAGSLAISAFGVGGGFSSAPSITPMGAYNVSGASLPALAAAPTPVSF